MAAGDDNSATGGPRVIALTGGIATGKSTVAALLAGHGAAVVDADAIAREVVEPGQPALAQITAEFADALGPDGRLDRSALGAIVFAHAARRRRLEEILHPRITALMAERVAAAVADGAPLVVADVPLLYEGGGQGGYDGVMVAWADADTQLERLMARDGLTRDAAVQRLAAQLPVDEKRARATWVVDNGGSPDATRAQVDAWWRDVMRPSRSR
ncbi:MAG TPA: dephospho-CoA kinase [Candidatus Dormibacteraeota bacterium]|nr:dephospho-CoA kinase [Candidatus Dormibacteraeota bacterium]